MPDLTNGFEGLASGTTISAGNSGGNSGTAFDSVSIGTGATLATDGAEAMHGLNGCKLATSGTAAAVNATWSTALGTQSQVWFRVYLFLAANPAVSLRVAWLASGATRCANCQINTAGKLNFLNTSGTALTTSTAAVPLNAWFRVEGFVIGSATTGQTEVKLFTTADGTSAAETNTSVSNANTFGSINTLTWGPNNSNASVGPFWLDDIGASAVAYMGPAPFLTRNLPVLQAVSRAGTY